MPNVRERPAIFGLGLNRKFHEPATQALHLFFGCRSQIVGRGDRPKAVRSGKGLQPSDSSTNQSLPDGNRLKSHSARREPIGFLQTTLSKLPRPHRPRHALISASGQCTNSEPRRMRVQPFKKESFRDALLPSQIRRTRPWSVAEVLRTRSSTRIIPMKGMTPAVTTIGSKA